VHGTALVLSESFESAIGDFNRIIGLSGALPFQVGLARSMLIVLLLFQDRWEAAIKDMPEVLKDVDGPLIAGICRQIVAAIFRHFGSSQVQKTRIGEVVKIFADHNVLNRLGDALVRHLSDLAIYPITSQGLSQWLAHWESSSREHEAMRLPLRLLRMGIDYLSSNPRDEGKLLQLPEEERILLRQALSLHS